MISNEEINKANEDYQLLFPDSPCSAFTAGAQFAERYYQNKLDEITQAMLAYKVSLAELKGGIPNGQ